MRPKRTDSLGRRGRMTPLSTGKRLRLTARDWLWMQMIHHHGPLSSTDLLGFSKGLAGNRARALNRLTDLFNEDDNGYGKPLLTRPPQQFQTMDARYNALIYGLSPAGETALKDKALWSPWVHRPGGPFWHQAMTAQITASVELACSARSDVNYIPGHKVLERAETKLRHMVRYTDPSTGRRAEKELIPDQIFGVEYLTAEGPRYRFYLVEADRGTEPIASSNAARKSILSMIAQHRAYLETGVYKGHLKLTAPLVTLICSEREFGVGIEAGCGKMVRVVLLANVVKMVLDWR